mmetsp:Transcript_39330/g.51477  ORF Transcript_39330/g.51477 Transcript_39330/m.51477 type:complete len:212 (+) Transcript_39330:508-1143(+)
MDVRVGELGAEQTVHVAVVAGHLKVSPEHLNGLVVARIDDLKGLLGGEDGVNHDVLILEAHSLALVDDGEDVEIPDGAAIKIVGVVVLNGREDAGLSELGVHHVGEVVTGQILLLKVDIGALEHVGEADVDPAVRGLDVDELGLEEVENSGVVPEATLEEEALSEATEPVLVELGVGGVLPEGLHAVGGVAFLTSGEVSKDGGVDGTTGHT